MRAGGPPVTSRSTGVSCSPRHAGQETVFRSVSCSFCARPASRRVSVMHRLTRRQVVRRRTLVLTPPFRCHPRLPAHVIVIVGVGSALVTVGCIRSPFSVPSTSRGGASQKPCQRGQSTFDTSSWSILQAPQGPAPRRARTSLAPQCSAGHYALSSLPFPSPVVLVTLTGLYYY